MKRYWLLPLCLACALPANSQTFTRQNIATIFGFENNSQSGVFPAGWYGNVGNSTIFTDNQVVHSGRYSARIQRTSQDTNSFSTLTQSFRSTSAATPSNGAATSRPATCAGTWPCG